MSLICVQKEAFNPGDEINAFSTRNSNSGAITSFVGQMRNFRGPDRTKGMPINTMLLEHYSGMAERQLSDLASSAQSRWPLDDILIIHRYGELKPGDPIVLVATASSHREPAFDACRFLMDWLKTQAPFWKKEISADGANWVESEESDKAKAARCNR